VGIIFIEKGIWIVIGPRVETWIDEVEESETIDYSNGEDLMFVEAFDAWSHFIDWLLRRQSLAWQMKSKERKKEAAKSAN
jgi:hypothetical protein